MFRTLIATTAILGALAPVPSAVAEPVVRSSVRVSYADLDLSREAGAYVLLQRIEAASQRVCGPRPSPRNLKIHIHYQACYRDAVSQAVAEVESPLLSALLDAPPRSRQVAVR
ncbi:MAG TPA: UrcA family protein [Hyphomonadaceae bacterium]